MATALRDGSLSLQATVDMLCDRIEQDDAVVQSLLPEEGRRERMHAEAQRLEERYSEAADRPPLYGVGVGVKDIFHVDGFVTRAGSSVPPHAFAGAEAQVVRQLRAAGALIVGKTVTTEFAYYEPGPTRNPHNPDHTPGGSSSGSAAAVAAGFCPLAIGTQTIGSVIRPAAFCGIVGFKPTLDRIATSGLVYFSPTMDHVGLFTQDAAGMALAAAALVSGWRGIRARPLPTVAVPVGPYLAQADRESEAVLEATVRRLEAAGVCVLRVPLLADIVELNALHRRLVFGEFARQHAALYPRYEEMYRPRTREIIAIGRGVSDAELDDLREGSLRLRELITEVMDSGDVDVWLTPAAPGAAPRGIGSTGDPNMNLPWTHTGMPAISLPAGFSENALPLGIQLVARFDADEDLLGWAIAFESTLKQSPI
jgi:Asp-tRNA(Asn)/Glu-tRNA(Gln) amidotransferase A subunit family amidase